MEATLLSLANNPLVTLGSFALAIIGIILAIIFYFRSQKNKIPCFAESSNTIIEGLNKALDGLEVHYKGKLQERVTVTKVVFWNDEKETIDKSDMVQKDPLRIEIPSSVMLLDVQIIDAKSDSNSVILGEPTLTENAVIYTLGFEYLDQNDYLVIQIVHSGSSLEKFEIKGKIKGAKSVRTSIGRAVINLMKTFPFIAPIAPFMFNQLRMKYFGSITYVSMGLFLVWNLLNGNTDWYVWLATGISFFAAVFLFIANRHITPVKI